MANSFGAQFKRRRGLANPSTLQGSNVLSALVKDTRFCRGMYNQQERNLQIQECKKMSGGLRIKVASAPLSQGEGGDKYMFFVCFGFTTQKPFFMPETVVEFEDRTVCKIQGTVVAEGKRPNEYAVVICFEDPIPCEYVSALLDHKFSITEMDNVKDMYACIHDLVKHYD